MPLNHGAADGLLIPWQGHIKLMFSCLISCRLQHMVFHSLFPCFPHPTVCPLAWLTSTYPWSFTLQGCFLQELLPSSLLSATTEVTPHIDLVPQCPLFLNCSLAYWVMSCAPGCTRLWLPFRKFGKLSRVCQAKKEQIGRGEKTNFTVVGRGSEQRSNKSAVVKSSQEHRLSEKQLLRIQSLSFPVTKDLGRTIIYHPANTLFLSHC